MACLLPGPCAKLERTVENSPGQRLTRKKERAKKNKNGEGRVSTEPERTIPPPVSGLPSVPIPQSFNYSGGHLDQDQDHLLQTLIAPILVKKLTKNHLL